MRRRDEIRKSMKYFEEMLDFKIFGEEDKDLFFNAFVNLWFARYGNQEVLEEAKNKYRLIKEKINGTPDSAGSQPNS